MAFLRTQASNRATWYDVLQDEEANIDRNGYLDGEWGRAIVAGARYEHSHPEWDQMPEYSQNGPAGQVIDFMNDCGFNHCMDGAAKLEDDTRRALEEEEGLSADVAEGDPKVWSKPICEPKGYARDMREMFESTFWCCICLLGGVGCSAPTDFCCLKSNKCCCVEGAAYCGDDCWGDLGPCFAFQKVCCCVSHQTCWPGGGPDDGVPICACCNIRTGEGDGDPDNNDNAKIMENAFLCFYCCCCGHGFSTHFPMVKGDSKCFCYRQFLSTASFCPKDRGICYDYGKCCCCVGVCTFPCGGASHDGIPTCACCGQNCGGEDAGDV
mmetsp:Transcript_43113/g.119247  ORF Transcript_43113/g.119247 Transcript_43113/m.119247 type:complete len:324 (+) Transcript_43113:63-1034(+)|eukprot:CAMPEP_0117523254 /NCGR_PEP_ID=MMETSP0784-20121206/34633_1 /TAXON_ID=39447 /ORGANISM="" /LENGTH=323 /DNA_ID=CAMNT_0005319361 /DNA_START=171 /DNA_END=1142 /DNA_ORIENTATION=-